MFYFIIFSSWKLCSIFRIIYTLIVIIIDLFGTLLISYSGL